MFEKNSEQICSMVNFVHCCEVFVRIYMASNSICFKWELGSMRLIFRARVNSFKA